MGGACPRCEKLPDKPASGGHLIIAAPLGHSGGKISRVLRQQGIVFEQTGNSLDVNVPPDALGELLRELDSELTTAEQRDTRVLFTRDGAPLRDLSGVESMQNFISREHDYWLVELLATDQLQSFFQPIVEAAHPDIIHGHECLMRGTFEGQARSPAQMLQAARRMDTMFALDLAARRSAIRGIAERRPAGRAFINFTPTAIYDPENCLRSTVALVQELGLSPGDIVFEVIETEEVTDKARLRHILDYYREGGFLVALDDLGAGYASLSLLESLAPDYVKIDRDLVRDVHRNHYRGTLVRLLLEASRELGLKVIAEGIESVEEAAWLRDHGADLLQGYLFAHPALDPPLLNKTAAY